MRIRSLLSPVLALTLLPLSALAATPRSPIFRPAAPVSSAASGDINYRGVLHALASAVSAQQDSVINGIDGGSVIDRNQDNICYNLGRAQNGTENMVVWLMVNGKHLEQKFTDLANELYDRTMLLQSFCHAFDVDSPLGKSVHRGDIRELKTQLPKLRSIVDTIIAGTGT